MLFSFHLKVEIAIYSIFFWKRHLSVHELSYMSRNKTLRITSRCCSSTKLSTFCPPTVCHRTAEKKVLRALRINCNSNPILLIGLVEPKKNLRRYVNAWYGFGSCRIARCAKSYFMCSLYAFFLSIYGFLNFVCKRKKANSLVHREWKMNESTNKPSNQLWRMIE